MTTILNDNAFKVMGDKKNTYNTNQMIVRCLDDTFNDIP